MLEEFSAPETLEKRKFNSHQLDLLLNLVVHIFYLSLSKRDHKRYSSAFGFSLLLLNDELHQFKEVRRFVNSSVHLVVF